MQSSTLKTKRPRFQYFENNVKSNKCYDFHRFPYCYQPQKCCKIQRHFTSLPVYTLKNTVAIKSMGDHINKYSVFYVIVPDAK